MAPKRRFDAPQGPGARSLDPHGLREALYSSPRVRESPNSQTSSITPASGPNPSSMPHTYAADASIVLIGLRGTGKSTLGVMVASALRYQLVDADRHFFQTTGLSRAAFKTSYGPEEYRRCEVEATRSILLENPSKAVIVCGPGSVEGTGQRLLRDFGKTHPVIYVEREVGEIQQYIGVCDAATFSHLVDLGRPVYRAISTFEFFNISEPFVSEAGQMPNQTHQIPMSLALKKVERDVLQFISSITHRQPRAPMVQILQGVSRQQPDCADFSYALQLPLSGLATIIPQLQGSDLMADAIDLIVDLPATVNGCKGFNHSIASFISEQFCLVRRSFQLPIVFEVQLSTDMVTGTACSISKREIQDLYYEILRFGLRLAPEYLRVDVTLENDERVRELIGAKGPTKIIGSYLDQRPGPDGWRGKGRREMFARIRDIGCDIIRLCQTAHSATDNISVQQFRLETEQLHPRHAPLIAYNTGIFGRTSCCLNRILTPVTHPLLRSASSAAVSEWLLTVPEAQNALFASFVLDQMYFGIFGLDVASSLSPAMHNAAFKLLGMPHKYRLFQGSSVDDLKTFAQDPHFGGASITSPFKSSIVPLLQSLSDDAQTIGAVNTLIPLRSLCSDPLLGQNRAGRIDGLHGENTDWKGIITCIHRNLSPINAVKPRTTALVLGAGGMARAAMFAMIRLGVRNIFIHNRTLQNAEQMANHFHGRTLLTDLGETVKPQFCPTPDAGESASSGGSSIGFCSIRVLPSMGAWPAKFQLPTIVVSCVPAHSSEGILTNLTVPHDWLGSVTGGVVIELAYDPVETPLITQARKLSDQGWIVVDGLQVLPEQAILQFEMFTGRKAPRKLMRTEVLKRCKETVNE